MARQSRFIQTCVKEVRQTAEYPGYQYLFFRSYAEFDVYFKEVCGADWRNQEWARFWFNDNRREQNACERSQDLPLEYANAQT